MASSSPGDRNHKLLLALRHPLRRRILRLMANEEAISPRELAEILGEPLANVAYHVKVLTQCGAVAPARNEQVSGAMQHFYCWSLKEDWAQKMLDEGEGGPPKDKA